MSNTVITNYTDLNGPSSKTDSSVVVIVNKDGSLSVDQNLLGTLMGSDGSQTAGISVVRVGHEGKPDDATDSENEDDKVPHVTLSVDSYYDEPNSIIKYDSGAEMLQSLRIETRENSLVGFHNDHCYTLLKSPSETISQAHDTFKGFDDPVIEITHTPPPKPLSTTPKKITVLEQQIIPKGKKIVISPGDAAAILKGKDVLNKPLPVLSKTKNVNEVDKLSEIESRAEDNTESSSVCSSGDSMADRDSDSDYKDVKDKPIAPKLRKGKTKPRILKTIPAKGMKLVPKIISRLKPIQKHIIRKDNKEKNLNKVLTLDRIQASTEVSSNKEAQFINTEAPTVVTDQTKVVPKQVQKIVKKEKKTPAHVSALLSDMTSLFSSPDVIRRVSTDGKTPLKPEKELSNSMKKAGNKDNEGIDDKLVTNVLQTPEISRIKVTKTYLKQKEKSIIPVDKTTKGYDTIPQLDDASLAQILQDTTQQSIKSQANIPTASVINSPGLAGPLSPTLDLLGGLQPEEDGLTEDLLMHVAQLVESSENLQEVIDKQVLGKVDTTPAKTQMTSTFQQVQLPMQTPQQMQVQAASNMYNQNVAKTGKHVVVRKDPIEIVRRDGRVITLPPIEAPATRASKRKSQVDTSISSETVTSAPIATHLASTPEPQVVQNVARQYTNKKLANKKQEQQQQPLQVPAVEKISAESQESWNSEDDPNRLWCICKQPHNNRFMICCDGCEDWFHGKCVNITKAMGQQMEEQGIEWRCPNCKNEKKHLNKSLTLQNTSEEPHHTQPAPAKELSPKTICIVCKKAARASSIYCSDACILKHAQDSLGTQGTQAKVEGFGGKVADKSQSESRVIVYERKSGRLLAGPNAPTAENLKTWLQKNPTFEVVRPGALSAIKPNLANKDKVMFKKKVLKSSADSNKIQTTLNFARIPRKSSEQIATGIKNVQEIKEKTVKPVLSPKEDIKLPMRPKTPTTPRLQTKLLDMQKASTSKVMSEPRKPVSRSANRSQSANERAPSASPSTSRRKDSHEPKKMNSVEPIRDNVRKALQEQMSARMAESDGPKFTEDEIQQFAYDTENELHELFGRDVGMKYKAKYRSLMFNIKDRKNLTLWEKICDRSITPKQLVRLSPEELASQELAQWRDKEAKHQLELIKKSELDLLAASKTYVLKTHKGEEVMENKESVSTELDPNVPVEDVVQALNEAVAEEPLSNAKTSDKSESVSKKSNNKKKDKDSSSRHSKRGESKRDHGKKKSRPSRRRSEIKEKEERSTRKSRKKSTRGRSESKERSKKESSKEKSVSRDRSRHRSRSRVKSKRYSKEHSRSNSRPRELERSHSSERARRLSRSKESPKRSRRSRSQHRTSTDEKNQHRSKSQETVFSKSKNDSTDSESMERPKSAMLKEVHPEYDPHEPMITSAFSEEDLRKSREDVYEESYKNEIGEFGDGGYEPSKSFSIDTNEILPPTPFVNKPDKISVTEAESDQEPSSTVEHSAATVWNGCINMVDVARFYVAAHEVSGNGMDLEEDLSTELDIVGRINPDTVWDYINKMKRASNKDIIVLRLQAANDEEMMQYIALYSYLSSRNRLGVVKVTNTATVKDFYIVPLPANTSLPTVLLPFDGPGLGDVKTHLLVAIIIRQRKKRAGPPIPKDIIPAKVARESRKRSYTPPLSAAGATGSFTPPASPRRRALPLPATYSSPALSSSIKDKIAATLASADDDEAYSPGSSSSSGSASAAPGPPGNANVLRSKMEELNRQIEEQKQQILKMAQADSSIEEDEAYSPSRPMTPPQPAIVPLSDIALPSNLQEILATIKQRSENPTGDVDMRQLT